MRILCVSGYAAWNKVSKSQMPSHHLFGIHEMIDYYVENEKGMLRGILHENLFREEGYVDFFIWKSGKKNIVKQIYKLLDLSKKYDLIYDQLNRCSIYLGFFKKIGIMKCNLLTIMHHPPYNLQLRISDSDGYVFFNEDYKILAEKACPKKNNKYYVNEWFPDTEWYNEIIDSGKEMAEAFFIDNGKSRRDRENLIVAAEESKIRIDYAGDRDDKQGYARAYRVDLKDDIAMIKRLRKYKAIVVPVLKNEKYKIGPLGITSFLDCIALGIPVVASDNVCFAKDIIEYKLGKIYKTGDVSSLSKALQEMSNNVAEYEKFKENMKEYRKNRDVSLYSEKLVKIIMTIVGNE